MLLSPVPKLTFLDNNGRPLVGGLLFTYEAGTSNKIDTYQDEGGTLNTNPVVLDFRGEANVWIDPQLTYKFILAPRGDTDPPTKPIWSVDDISALGGTQTIGQVLYPRTQEEIDASITPVAYQWPPRTLTRYAGILADGATDCTSAMLTVCNAMGGTFTLPYNCLYDRTDFITNVSANVLLQDQSQINDLTSPGETTKNVGIVAGDIATNDSGWFIETGHHPGLILNNFGTSGTLSATRRLASVVWADGMFQNAGLAKRGSRGAATFQFLKDPSGDYWINKLTLNAPWLSINGYYEDWQPGETVGVGVYRRNAGSQYVSSTSGTTANPGPVNTSGSAPDGGGVQWTWLDSADRGVYQVDQYGRWLIGEDAVVYTWELRPSRADPDGGNCSMILKAGPDSISKTSEFHLWSSDAGGVEIAHPFFRATTGTGLTVVRADGSNVMMSWDGTTGIRITNTMLSLAPSASSPATGNNGTIATANLGVSKVTPAGAITGVILESGTVDGQECTVLNQSGSTITFAAYATSHVASGTGCVIPATRGTRFVWDSVAAAWYACA